MHQIRLLQRDCLALNRACIAMRPMLGAGCLNARQRRYGTHLRQWQETLDTGGVEETCSRQPKTERR